MGAGGSGGHAGWGTLGFFCSSNRMSTTTADSGRMPRQISYIIGNEACERFSFYGMRNILVPFLISSILLAYLPEGPERDTAAKDIFHMS